MIPSFGLNNQSLKLKDIAFLTGSTILKVNDLNKNNSEEKACDDNREFNGLASLEKATPNDVSFFNTNTYLELFENTKAGACFIAEKNINKAPKGLLLLVNKDPYAAFATLSQQFFPLGRVSAYTSPYALIDKSAVIGKNAHISAFAVIGKNVVIGEDCYIGEHVVINDNVKIGSLAIIHAQVTIKYSKIGDNFICHEGSRIGQDGFGFAPNKGGHIKIPQIGKVVIGNDVEIGANSCIDRGALNDTEIGDGTKLDNMVQIAHNVKIGKHCFIASGAALAGSVSLGDYVSIGGAAAIAPHLKIHSGSQIGPMSGVTRDVEVNQTVMGIPAIPFTSFWRLNVLFKKMLEKSK
ncbi:UDP-3-O-(3-hydroxymyristoyl)glucosamine N-acyltransferase [Candidatus Hepatincolaceae symbiont of Richtersius coronifer]